MATTPKPGIYENMTYEQYAAIPAIRRSDVNEGIRSMHHMQHHMESGEDSSTDALMFGQALHAAVLEPDRFERDVVLGEINPKTGEPFGIDTKAQQAFISANPGKVIIGKSHREKIIGMGAAIRNHPRAGALVRSCSQTELVLVWEDSSSGVLCKARLDGLATGGLGIMDLKSTTDAAHGAFGRSVYDYGYHRQAAMAIDGWKSLTRETFPFTIVAIEKDAPFELMLYAVSFGSDAHGVGQAEYRSVLHEVKKARETGVWEGYPKDVQDLELPKWVLQRFHDAA